MTATFIGVRHHSPACSRVVRSTIETLRPAYVLVEGPADMNDRLGELLLGHELPVAVFSSYRDDERAHASWAPFCDYSPEWAALTAGRACGAQVRFIDLPAWHPAFAERQNRYADAEQRYADVVDRLCKAFAVDNVDTLWDHLFEIEPDELLAERLDAYFDLVRDESPAGADDTAREAYMARWIRAAIQEAGDRPVVVVTGGFHRAALIRLVNGGSGGSGGGAAVAAGSGGGAAGVAGSGGGAAVAAGSGAGAAGVAGSGGGAAVAAGSGGDGGLDDVGWPEVPRLPDDAIGGSYLVPYSFKRLDAFDGYQSGMPSPGYYQRLWDEGPRGAADHLVEAVVGRLRKRKQPVSTADLIAARTSAEGLARVRGHRHPARADVLDGLATALVGEALDVPLPWATRGLLRAGTHPVVVEMVAALSGSRVGRLHPDTPLPPLVHDVTATLERHGFDGAAEVRLDLTTDDGLARSRLLHRLRVLRIPGFVRETGPTTGVDPVLEEHWTLSPVDTRLPALIEAGAYGVTLGEAANAAIEERVGPSAGDVERLAGALFDAALCGIAELSGRVLTEIGRSIGASRELAPLGRVLAVVLGLWRHDRLLGTARSATLGAAIASAVDRVLWLAEGIRGGAAPADLARLGALVATRDAILHAGPALDLDRQGALEVMARVAAAHDAPPDLRGGAFGFGWSLGHGGEAARALRGAGTPETVGDWLAGLFALAREALLTVDDHAGGIAAATRPGEAEPEGVVVAGGVAAAARSGEGVAVGGGAGAAARPGGVEPDGGVGAAARQTVAAAREDALVAHVADAGGVVVAEMPADGVGRVSRERLLDVLDELIGMLADHEFLVALPALRQAFTYFPPRERDAIAGQLLARRGLAGSGRALLRTEAPPEVLLRGHALEADVDALLAREGLLDPVAIGAASDVPEPA
jgi:hypothetical protein